MAAAQSTDSARIVRAISIAGNETTKEYVITRELAMKTGDTLTAASLEFNRNRVYNLQLFNKVEAEQRDVDGGVAVTFRVYERWYIFPRPVLGFKYRDLEKFYYGAGLSHANFRGRNEKLFVSFATGYDQWINFVYQNPKLTADDDIFFRLTLQYQNQHSLNVSSVEYLNTNYNANVSLGKRYGLFSTVVATYGYTSLHVGDLVPGRTVSADGTDEFFWLNASYSYDSRNVREYPTDGMLFSGSISKFGFGASPLDIISYHADVRKFYPLNETFSFGVRSFATTTVGGVVPEHKRTFFGFDERVRGYFRDRLEGESSWGVNAEVRFPLLPPETHELDFIPLDQFKYFRFGIYGGLFADAGKIWFRNENVLEAPLYSGVGAGLHFLLGYSMVLRAEAAVNDQGRTQYYFDIGASF
jgi:outer membrane protein assembly factor BamA